MPTITPIKWDDGNWEPYQRGYNLKTTNFKINGNLTNFYVQSGSSDFCPSAKPFIPVADLDNFKDTGSTAANLTAMATYSAANNGYCPLNIFSMCQVDTLSGNKGYV